MQSQKHLIVIVGPTAIGKTAMAIAVAKKLCTEIVSADSRQLFKEMSIGTAKPNSGELNAVPHHFIGSHSITENYNVGKFESEALAKIEELHKTHDTVVMVGGSGLYINAVCNGFDDLPEANQQLRDKLAETLANKGIEALQEQLQALDPEYYNQINIANPHRLIRALEVCIVSGKTYTELRKNTRKTRPFNIIKIGLDMDRNLLYKRINQRVDMMMSEGLLKEAMDLYSQKDLNALQTVGYSELFDFMDNKISLEKAIEQIKQNTRRYAKRQLTWFRRDEETKWFSPEDEKKIIDTLLLVNNANQGLAINNSMLI
jgi:tRNA dimethylallyltransferase